MEGLEASIVTAGVLNEEHRFDAQFFQKAYLAEGQALNGHTLSTISEFAFVTDGPHGYHEVDDGSPIAMLTAKCVSDWFAEREGADTIARWVDDANKRSSLEVNDLILSTRGTVGNCAVVTFEALPANLDQDVARIAMLENSPFQPLFLLAYLNSRFGQDHIARHSSGMVQQGLSLTKVRDIPVPLLSEPFQVRVSDTIEESLRLRRETRAKHKEAEDTLLEALGLADWKPPEPLSYTARASDAFTASRLDAQYFMPAKEQVRQSLAAMPGDRLGERMNSIRNMFVPDCAPATMKLRNYNVTAALVSLLDAEKEPSFASGIGSIKKTFKDGDVVISRLRAYLREIAVVSTCDDIPSIGSSEFIVLRPKKGQCDISPETLMVFLRSAPVQTVLKWCQKGSQHPRFSEGDLLSIPVPDAVAEVSGQVTTIVKKGFAARRCARQLLEAAKRAVEIAIENGEADAMAFLNQTKGQTDGASH